MAWVFLACAGLLEVFWSSFLKLSDGFTKLGWSVMTIAGMLASFYLLSQAMKTLPLGTAYAVWTGIGAVGSVAVGILIFKEPVTAARYPVLEIIKSRMQEQGVRLALMSGSGPTMFAIAPDGVVAARVASALEGLNLELAVTHTTGRSGQV